MPRVFTKRKITNHTALPRLAECQRARLFQKRLQIIIRKKTEPSVKINPAIPPLNIEVKLKLFIYISVTL